MLTSQDDLARCGSCLQDQLFGIALKPNDRESVGQQLRQFVSDVESDISATRMPVKVMTLGAPDSTAMSIPFVSFATHSGWFAVSVGPFANP